MSSSMIFTSLVFFLILKTKTMITTHSGLRRALTENYEAQEYIEVPGLPIEYAKTIIEHSISGYL